MDYYFQEQVRWTLGFENPNKTGALVASCLPLLWLLYKIAGRIGRSGLRRAAMWLASVALCGGWWVLFKTYSRGGIVAAACGFAYLGWRSWRGPSGTPRGKAGALALALAVGALFFSTAAAERSTQWVGRREGSVENRYTLWQGGLRMIAAIPQGVGRGHSGEFYMQWFQPLDGATRYRTLVNSYLTFAAENGLLALAAASFFALLIWLAPRRNPPGSLAEEIACACRAALIAFAVAGFFSTTMEEGRLWIVPGIAAGSLLAMIAWQRSWPIPKRTSLAAATAAATLCGALWLAGWSLGRADDLRVVRRGARVELHPASSTAPAIHVLLDPEVLGRNFGKLMRRLALHRRGPVVVSPSENAIPGGQIVVAVGRAVDGATWPPARRLVLLAPAPIDAERARKILSSSRPALLLLPGFDEDGRAAFWQEMADEHRAGEKPRCETLDGVGTQVEWAWEQVLSSVKRFTAPQEPR